MNTTFLNHIRELRNRLTLFLLVFFLFSIFGYLLRNYLIDIILWPLNQNIYYTTPAGGFNFVLSLSIVFGLICSLPILLFEVIQFIKPAFPNNSISVFKFVAGSLFFVLFGILFAYFVALPAALNFLQQLSPVNVKSLITTEAYTSFVIRYLLGFALLFQLPLGLLVLNSFNQLSLKKLLSLEKWVILGAFTFAAILTPTPDIINQLIMAVPIIVLYQISILMVFITNKRR